MSIGSPDDLSGKKEYIGKRLEFSEEDKEALYLEVLKLFVRAPLVNSPELGNYKNSELSTTEVTKKLQGLGLMEILKEFDSRISHLSLKYNEIEDKAVDFERLARILLKVVETFIADKKNKS